MKEYQYVGLRSVPLFPESLPWPNMRYKTREEFELERFRRLLGVEDEKYKLMNDLERLFVDVRR
jgi:ribosomal protein S10